MGGAASPRPLQRRHVWRIPPLLWGCVRVVRTSPGGSKSPRNTNGIQPVFVEYAVWGWPKAHCHDGIHCPAFPLYNIKSAQEGDVEMEQPPLLPFARPSSLLEFYQATSPSASDILLDQAAL